ncbi:creatininase family protein, partial [Geminisphaera colitermitum]|uniref:creatininase family protein n=1 Tax=Geminisphaera colitermitum TaxID=1148786 RepID=UPI0018E2953A
MSATRDNPPSPPPGWAQLPTTAFAALAAQPGALAILPVYDHADHGLGLPLNAGEVLGSALLSAALRATNVQPSAVSVLPPLRFGPAPYPSTFFGVDADTALQLVNELARGVRRAGFERLLIFSTGPWHREWLNAAALDIRVATGLRVFRLHLSALELDFHPAAPAA